MKILKISSVVLVIAFGLAFWRSWQTCRIIESTGAQVNQGCINQGRDCREFATVICWLQRQFSWKSQHEPPFALLGSPAATNLGLAWPPYLVFNWPDGKGRWRVFRVGFRYDRTWRGYIFPTIALEHRDQPLRY